MKLRYLYILFSALFAGMVISSCVKKPKYPSEPVIAYKDYLRYGDPTDPDSSEVVVTFTDNEGDIGLEQDDTNGFFKYGNIWMVYFYWDTAGTDHWSALDTSFTNPQFDTLKIAYRVPPVLPAGDKSEPMKGLIYVKQQYPVTFHEKIKYVVYLYDKALHRSDTIHTPAILF